MSATLKNAEALVFDCRGAFAAQEFDSTVKDRSLKLDLEDQRLWRGGSVIPLSNKAFDLLELLVSKPNRLITKGEILDFLWGETNVTEGLVKEYIHDLRQALGDNARRPKLIQTVRGKGYRYLGGITVSGLTAPAPTTVSSKPSIAVLPFQPIDGSDPDDYFADGLTEEIITALSFIPSFFVIARNSTLAYKGKSADLREVRRDLGVEYALEGTVRKADHRTRVTCRLGDTRTGVQIWADRYEFEMQHVFEVQDRITSAVAAAIGPTVDMAEIRNAVRKHPGNLSSYDLYLRARAALNAFRVDEAVRLLDRAIDIEPTFAKAKALRSWCATLIGWRFVPASETDRSYALELAEDALSSADCDPETQAYAAYSIGFFSSQHTRALSLEEDVTRHCPSFSWAWASLALLEAYHGDQERAIRLADKALELNPRDPQSFRCEMATSKALLAQRRFEEALTCATRGLAKRPDNAFFHMCRITCLVKLGNELEARTFAKEFRRLYPDFTNTKWRDLTRLWVAWKSTSAMLLHAMRAVGIPD